MTLYTTIAKAIFDEIERHQLQREPITLSAIERVVEANLRAPTPTPTWLWLDTKDLPSTTVEFTLDNGRDDQDENDCDEDVEWHRRHIVAMLNSMGVHVHSIETETGKTCVKARIPNGSEIVHISYGDLEDRLGSICSVMSHIVQTSRVESSANGV